MRVLFSAWKWSCRLSSVEVGSSGCGGMGASAMPLQRAVFWLVLCRLTLPYFTQAPSSPSSPIANEPKYEKRWLDTLSVPLSMARISRYKAGTERLRYVTDAGGGANWWPWHCRERQWTHTVGTSDKPLILPIPSTASVSDSTVGKHGELSLQCSIWGGIEGQEKRNAEAIGVVDLHFISFFF